MQDTPDEYKLHVMSTAMQSDALVWYKAHAPNFVSYAHCVQQFRNKFMGKDTQKAMRRNLEENRYVPQSGKSYSQHLLEMMVCNLDLLVPYREGEFVEILAKHYSILIRQVIIARNITSLTELEELMLSLDLAEQDNARRTIIAPRPSNHAFGLKKRNGDNNKGTPGNSKKTINSIEIGNEKGEELIAGQSSN